MADQFGLTPQLLDRLQHTVRKRILRHFRRHGLLEPHDTEDMLTWDHGGGFSLDASVRIEASDRAGVDRLIRYCARPPFALERLATLLPPPRIHRPRYHGVFAPNAPLRPLVTARTQEDNAAATNQNLVAHQPLRPPPGPPAKLDPPAPVSSATGSSRPSKWAALLARIYETFPLICPSCQTPLSFIASLTDPLPIGLTCSQHLTVEIGDHRELGGSPSRPTGVSLPTGGGRPRSTPPSHLPNGTPENSRPPSPGPPPAVMPPRT